MSNDTKATDPLSRVRVALRRKDLKRIGQMVRDAKPVPVGTILGNGQVRMVVTGHGYYDMDLNRYDKRGAGTELMYEGDLVRGTFGRVEFVRNAQGEKCSDRMLPKNIRAVLLATEIH